MKERVLITGASGFIGYHLITEALKNNLEVYAAVRKSSDTEHLKGLDIKLIYPDFDNVAALQQDIALTGYNYIIHAAGVTKARSANEYDHINAGYTQNLADAITRSGHPIKKLVLVSSLAAIGPLPTLQGVINENTAAHPVTAYGRSKLLAEVKLNAFPAVNYSILRPTGVYGPRDKDIFIFFKQLTIGIEPYIGSTGQKFSFLYVADLAKATMKALFSDKNGVYNLSDGNYYDRYELGRLSKDILNLKTVKFHLPVNFVKLIAKASEKYCSLKNKASVLNVEKLNELMAVNWYCDIEQAKADLDYYPEYNLRSGLEETLTWYKANKWL